MAKRKRSPTRHLEPEREAEPLTPRWVHGTTTSILVDADGAEVAVISVERGGRAAWHLRHGNKTEGVHVGGDALTGAVAAVVRRLVQAGLQHLVPR